MCLCDLSFDWALISVQFFGSLNSRQKSFGDPFGTHWAHTRIKWIDEFRADSRKKEMTESNVGHRRAWILDEVMCWAHVVLRQLFFHWEHWHSVCILNTLCTKIFFSLILRFITTVSLQRKDSFILLCCALVLNQHYSHVSQLWVYQ